MKSTHICETCQSRFTINQESSEEEKSMEGIPSSDSEGETGGRLTSDPLQSIMEKGIPTRQVFSSLCPRCREEAWEGESHYLPGYPYKQ